MKTIRSQMVYKDRWIRFRVDTVIQDGTEAPYGVVERANSVIIIPIAPSNKTLLLRQDRHPMQAESLEFPMGSIDPNESPEAAARRELFEECRIAVDTLQLIGEFHPVPALMAQRASVFVAEIDDRVLGDAFVPPGTDEIIAQEIVSVDELPRLARIGAVTDGFTLSAIAIGVMVGAIRIAR